MFHCYLGNLASDPAYSGSVGDHGNGNDNPNQAGCLSANLIDCTFNTKLM